MLRKTLIALAATAALGMGAGTADAKMGSGQGGQPTGVHTGPVSPGPSHFTGGSNITTVAPRPAGTLSGTTNWNPAGRHHRHHRNAVFFGVGFAGAYDY